MTGTLKIENVNLAMLEGQRHALHRILYSYQFTNSDRGTLEGIAFMLDAWADRRDELNRHRHMHMEPGK